MKRVTKSRLATLVIFLVILFLVYISLSKPTPETDSQIVQCIGEKSILYVQLGCSHCRTQEEIFGDNLQYLNKIDCFYEPSKCEGITATPTWKIKGELYTGVQQIDKLRELTGC